MMKFSPISLTQKVKDLFERGYDTQTESEGFGLTAVQYGIQLLCAELMSANRVPWDHILPAIKQYASIDDFRVEPTEGPFKGTSSLKLLVESASCYTENLPLEAFIQLFSDHITIEHFRGRLIYLALEKAAQGGSGVHAWQTLQYYFFNEFELKDFEGTPNGFLLAQTAARHNFPDISLLLHRRFPTINTGSLEDFDSTCLRLRYVNTPENITTTNINSLKILEFTEFYQRLYHYAHIARNDQTLSEFEKQQHFQNIVDEAELLCHGHSQTSEVYFLLAHQLFAEADESENWFTCMRQIKTDSVLADEAHLMMAERYLSGIYNVEGKEIDSLPCPQHGEARRQALLEGLKLVVKPIQRIEHTQSYAFLRKRLLIAYLGAPQATQSGLLDTIEAETNFQLLYSKILSLRFEAQLLSLSSSLDELTSSDGSPRKRSSPSTLLFTQQSKRAKFTGQARNHNDDDNELQPSDVNLQVRPKRHRLSLDDE